MGGFTDQEIVALSGAHALGRCHSTRSGFEGPWTKAPTMFSNEYYRELLENDWSVKNWSGPKQYEDRSKELMMLRLTCACSTIRRSARGLKSTPPTNNSSLRTLPKLSKSCRRTASRRSSRGTNSGEQKIKICSFVRK